MTHQEKVKQRADALAAKAKAPKTPIKFLSNMDSQFRRDLAANKPTAPKPITRETKGEKIWKLHESGMTLKEISIEMNMTRNNASAHLSTERKKRGLI